MGHQNPPDVVVKMDSVEESPFNLAEHKVFNLPSISQLVIRDGGMVGADGKDNDASLNFEDLMSMEPPEGVDFYASYDQVPKAKVKIPKKLRAKKNLNSSCPSFGHAENDDRNNATTKKTKTRRRKSKRSQSAMEGRAPGRSLSFTSTPPQHFDLKIPKPKPIPPRRTKSLHSSFPIGGSSGQFSSDLYQPMFSSCGAFKPLHSSASSFSTVPTQEAKADFVPLQTTERMHHSFTVMPSDSGEFLPTSLAPLEKNKHTQRIRNQSKSVSAMNELRSRSKSPGRSKPMVLASVKSSLSATKSEILRQSPVEKRDVDVDGYILSTPRSSGPTLPPRSKSLNSLGLRIEVFKSPMKYDVLRKTSTRRKLSGRLGTQADPPRRHRAVVEQPPSSPGRQRRRQLSPRRGSRRSAFLVKSKSARLLETSDSIATLEMERHKPMATSNPPRRVKSLCIGRKDRSPSSERPRLTDPNYRSRLALDDSFSVSASEAVPLATFAFSKNTIQNKSQMRKTFKDTLHLVGKWKRSAKQEDEHSQRPARSIDAKLHNSKDCVSMTPETSVSSEEHSSCMRPQRKPNRRRSKKTTRHDESRTSLANIEQPGHTYKEKSSSHRENEAGKERDDNFEEDSLADVLETKEARLESYLTRTPQKERKKVDRYWIEAFKRNYTRRGDLAGSGGVGSSANS